MRERERRERMRLKESFGMCVSVWINTKAYIKELAQYTTKTSYFKNGLGVSLVCKLI